MNDPGAKKCPYCGESIRLDAAKCRFCGEFLEPVPTEKPARPGPQAPSAFVPPETAGVPPPADEKVYFEGNVSRIVLIRPAAAVLFWFAVAIAVCAMAGQLGEASGSAGLVNALRISGAVVATVAVLYWVYRWLEFRNTLYRVTGSRLEFERGIFAKRISNMDMWRVQDVTFTRTFLQALFGLGCVRILSSDRDTPVLQIGPVRGARQLYDAIKKVQLEADRRQGVIHGEF